MTQKQAIQLFEDRKVRTVWDERTETMCIPDGLVLVIRLSAGGRFTKMSKMLCAF